MSEIFLLSLFFAIFTEKKIRHKKNHKCTWLFQKQSFVGKSRSGKSSLTTSLLTNQHIYRNAFHNVIIVIPKHSFHPMSPENNPFLALDKEKICHDFGFDILAQVYNQIIVYAQDEVDTLLRTDDYASELKNGDVLKLLKRLGECSNIQIYSF